MRIPARSIEYVHVPVTATAGREAADVTARMAMVPTSSPGPEEGDWSPAAVDVHTGAVFRGPTHTIRARYGGDRDPGALAVWVEITAGDEVVLARAGALELT